MKEFYPVHVDRAVTFKLKLAKNAVLVIKSTCYTIELKPSNKKTILYLDFQLLNFEQSRQTSCANKM